MLVEFQTRSGDRRVLISLKPGSMSVSLNEVEVYSFDWEGRLLTAWVNDQTFVRTLDNRVVKKWRDPLTPWKLIRELEVDEKQSFLNQTWARMNDLYQLSRGRLQAVLPRSEGRGGPLTKQARDWLERIIVWDFQRLENERERFFSVYTPVSILPPDQYFALVLQATEGCHWNRCTFCHFYRHGHFRIKSDVEFGQHIAAAKAFFGEAISLRRSIFLGDANALVVPQDRLLRIFERVNEAFLIAAPGSKPGADGRHFFQGIYSFIDAFSGNRKSAADFRELKARNLRRVYLGVETGCDDLLQFLNKPATAEQVLETVTAIKRASLSVGVMILIGVGGDRYFQPHVEQTIRLLNALNLGQGDILYFSPLFESPISEYAPRAAEAGIRSLTDQERREQLAAIRSGLRFPNGKPKVSLYDIREFIY